jgi:hypothetical protein
VISKCIKGARYKERDRAVSELGNFMTKGELTWKRIVEAAAPIFNQHGYGGSSLKALWQRLA